MRRTLTVLATGPLTTVQDTGRVGQGALGVGRSGACDRASYRLANRLVGNRPGAAVLEVTFGGLSLRADHDVTLVTTGARCAGRVPHNAPELLRAGTELHLGVPDSGLRTYLAVRGGIAAEPVLGARATDVMAGIGPPVVGEGDVLPVGDDTHTFPPVDVAPVEDPAAGDVTVRVVSGPRRDWFTGDAWRTLTREAYRAGSDCDRVGVRLDGPPLERDRSGELQSEGMVRGALQVPHAGTPVVFLADHPVTGGYPVIGYVVDDDVDLCAQVRPGQALRFRDCSGVTGPAG